MAFPISYPVVDGSGRLTEICTFLSEIATSVAKFPISRQGIVGVQTADHQVVAMLADWTSAAEKDQFEPGEQYQSVKPGFGKIIDGANPSFACHHIVLPTGSDKTPQAASYIVSHATVPQADQAAAAAAYAEFIKPPAHFDFLADAATAAAFRQSDVYKSLQATVAKVATATSSYDVEYQSPRVLTDPHGADDVNDAKSDGIDKTVAQEECPLVRGNLHADADGREDNAQGDGVLAADTVHDQPSIIDPMEM
ncbi:hypothetical protein SPBR_09169 [Sporothrix brasiliensis 5110]|uniref:ABM domain-containing protein n=1 Tax=Sporothrix brasiliensis 5110 TaxID=1398154 RepID=A0A0C2F4E7_9PEZI|nr:uncharacterized protein SPBR_09169 [Sporothrix brasiliensis 5110]KIH93769.1 hypothetical protein SPBR_09169 [Sporothrix brasiliensis 5110]